MTKKKKKNEKNKLFAIIAAVIAIIAIIAGSTFAYWTWTTDNSSQQTLVNVTVKGATLTITGNNIDNAQDSVTLRPTNQCNSDKALIGESTVTVVNSTQTVMRATPRLDITLTPDNNRTFKEYDQTTNPDGPDLKHLHWALVDITTDASKTCLSPDYQGTFYDVAKVTVSGGGKTDVLVTGPTVSKMTEKTLATMNITNMDSSNNITDTLSFVAAAATSDNTGVITDATTTKKYRLYIWLDDSYEHNNVGNTVTDPMQDLQIKVAWSTKSTLIQE